MNRVRLSNMQKVSSIRHALCAVATAALCAGLVPGWQAVTWAGQPIVNVQQGANVKEQLASTAKDMLALSETDTDLKKGNMVKARELVEKRVLPLLDKEELAKRAVGKYWRETSPEQREKLTLLVPRLLGKTYAKALFDLRGAKVEFTSARVSDGLARIGARITPLSGEKMQMGFITAMDKDQNAQVQDILIEGVSLMGAFAANFSAVIAKKGIDGLIVSLEEKIG